MKSKYFWLAKPSNNTTSQMVNVNGLKSLQYTMKNEDFSA